MEEVIKYLTIMLLLFNIVFFVFYHGKYTEKIKEEKAAKIEAERIAGEKKAVVSTSAVPQAVGVEVRLVGCKGLSSNIQGLAPLQSNRQHPRQS